MKTALPFFTLLSVLLIPAQSEAILTLRFDGNGLSDFRVEDGSAHDIDGMVNGAISADATTFAGWSGAGASFMVSADVIQEKAGSSSGSGGGQINVVADYDHTGGFLMAISVAASELFTVKQNAVSEFTARLGITGDGDVTANDHYFSSSFPDPAPLDPFAFAGYPEQITLAPPPVASPFAVESQTFPGGLLGTRLRIANSFTAVINPGDIGTIAMTTIVNPEPASLLLSAFGAGLFGLGYRRRRQLRADAA